MTRAIWNGTVIAESNDTVVVEGNHYFPRASVRTQYLRPSPSHTLCPWKGTASYFSLDVEGASNPDAAWYYPSPKPPPSRSPAGWRSGTESPSRTDGP